MQYIEIIKGGLYMKEIMGPNDQIQLRLITLLKIQRISKARGAMIEIFRRIFASHMFDPSFSQAYAEIYFG